MFYGRKERSRLRNKLKIGDGGGTLMGARKMPLGDYSISNTAIIISIAVARSRSLTGNGNGEAGSAGKGQYRRQGGDLTSRYGIHVQTSGNERI